MFWDTLNCAMVCCVAGPVNIQGNVNWTPDEIPNKEC